MTPTPRVDWALAGTIGGRLARPGPRDVTLSADERAELVASLRAAGDQAAEHVVRLTGLEPADGGGLDGPHGTGLSPVRVVDRATWVARNTRMLAAMTSPAGADIDAVLTRPAGGLLTRTTAAGELAAVLAFLAGRVLGQFDPFAAPVPDPDAPSGATRPGVLMLVAPSVLQVERRLHADPDDFRLWVALHEQTHALQAATAPWLAEHLRAQAAAILASTDDEEADEAGLAGRLRALATAEPWGGALNPQQRETVERLGAVMALLEGHADVTMDAVGRSVVPTVHQIRSAFDRTRAPGSGPLWHRLVRRLVGLDAKIAQYTDGAAFVRAVHRQGGRSALAAAFSGPDALPTPIEITDPRAWLRRVAP